jgi:hypothetical protein
MVDQFYLMSYFYSFGSGCLQVPEGAMLKWIMKPILNSA